MNGVSDAKRRVFHFYSIFIGFVHFALLCIQNASQAIAFALFSLAHDIFPSRRCDLCFSASDSLLNRHLAMAHEVRFIRAILAESANISHLFEPLRRNSENNLDSFPRKSINKLEYILVKKIDLESNSNIQHGGWSEAKLRHLS